MQYGWNDDDNKIYNSFRIQLGPFSGGVGMRNNMLARVKRYIPYIPELREVTGSVEASLLMVQLDWMFEQKPDGFFKFQAPCDNPQYKAGSSWIEETKFSSDELRTAFDKIGVRYRSKSDFIKAEDKFQGKFYCSYHDKRAQLTWYFRNHAMVDAALDLAFNQNIATNTINQDEKGPIPASFPGNRYNPSTVNRGSQVTVNELTQATVNRGSQELGNGQGRATVAGQALALQAGNVEVMELGNAKVMEVGQANSGITEYDSNENKQPLHTGQAKGEIGSSGFCLENLFFPTQALPAERQVLSDLLAGCPESKRQAILDEIEGVIVAGKLKTGIVQLCRALVGIVADGKFVESAGVAVRAKRDAMKLRDEQQAQQKQQMQHSIEAEWKELTAEQFNRLPKMAQKAYLQQKERRAGFLTLETGTGQNGLQAG